MALRALADRRIEQAILAVDPLAEAADLGADEVAGDRIGVAAVDLQDAALLDRDVERAGIGAVERAGGADGGVSPGLRVPVAPCPIIAGLNRAPPETTPSVDSFLDISSFAGGTHVDPGCARVAFRSLGSASGSSRRRASPVVARGLVRVFFHLASTGSVVRGAIWPSPNTSPTRSFCSSDRSMQPS